MGFISDLIRSKSTVKGERIPSQRVSIWDSREDSRRTWREVFGTIGTNKEESKPKDIQQNSGWGRSASSDNAFKRLLQAMRSNAPGGWSDDRWEQTKHFVGLVYVVIHRTGEQLAQSEFQVFQKDDQHPNGKRPVAKGHPGYELVKLLEKPNNDDSWGDYIYRLNMQMDLTGKALTWMVPNQLGTPMEIYSIPTALAIPQPCVNPQYPHGFYRIQPVYPYGPFSSYPTPNSAVGAAIPAEWMLDIKYPHPFLRYDGYSPLTAMRLHIDEIESIDRSRWYQMKRVVKPSAVLNFGETDGMQPLPEPEIERIRADFESDLQGPENVGSLFVATPGAKLEPWESAVELDHQAGWSQLTDFVMGGGFGITKPAVGMVEDSSYATLFATLKQLHLLTLVPKAKRIASKLTRHLAPFFGDNLIVEIRLPRIDDHDVKNAKLQVLISGKSITKGELRRELDMPRYGDERDDETAGEGPEQQQMGMGMPGQPEQGPATMQTADADMEQADEQAKKERQEVERTRPTPGNLGQGALGPRKSLNGYHLENRVNGIQKDVVGVKKSVELLNGKVKKIGRKK